MHYKNGREAHNGDKVLFMQEWMKTNDDGTIERVIGTPVVGILYDATPGNNDCNGKIALTSTNDPMPDLKECLHILDVGDISGIVSGGGTDLQAGHTDGNQTNEKQP